MSAASVSFVVHPTLRQPNDGGAAGSNSRGEPHHLVDNYGRLHTDLRISLTDRCNLRCVYCMEEDATFLPRADILTFEEIERVATVAHRLGVESVRLTGGEPLLRHGVIDLVSRLANIGFSDLSMTTNGVRLDTMSAHLRRAGLTRVNISCDSLRPDRFAQIRRRGDLQHTLAAMEAAEAAGLIPLKVNVVILAGVNDDEILDFAAFARDFRRIVRFIEFMPLDAGGRWSRDHLVPGETILARIAAQWPVDPVEPQVESAPAERFRFRDGAGEIGIVSSVTRPFCGTCNRLRLTADGVFRNCLFSDDELSVRDVLRRGGTDADIEQLMRRSVRRKLPGHGINEPGFVPPVRSMSMIGG